MYITMVNRGHRSGVLESPVSITAPVAICPIRGRVNAPDPLPTRSESQIFAMNWLQSLDSSPVLPDSSILRFGDHAAP